MIKRILVTAGMVSLSFAAFSTAAPTQAEAACGCKVKWNKCMRKAGANANTCNAQFNSCSSACSDKKECKKECRAVKKDAKNTCKQAFRESLCQNKGKAKRQCKSRLRKEKKACMKAARTNCNKVCK